MLRSASLFALLALCTILPARNTFADQSPAAVQRAARGLLERVLPERADDFRIEAIPKEGELDVFEIESADGRIVLRGSSGVAVASALNWYLRRQGLGSVSWQGRQLDLPSPLPPLERKVRIVSPFRYRYSLNFCAFSYSLAFFDWPRWERLIDWMALYGINMPLSVTGQEGVWRAVGHRFGLTDAELAEFLAGPAYLPFGWMGCLDGWGGPLPKSWIDSHVELQKKIVARERELGMTPVLQGFTGHVPPALRTKVPDAKFKQLPKWCNFPPTYFIDPLDPFFVEFGNAFVEEQTRLFGTDHLYASDTFIEMSPPSNDPAFLAAMGKAVYDGMRGADPEAKWVLQGWLFVNNPSFWKPPQARAMFGAVPDDRMILLDLACEARPVWSETDAFYGKPWLWCIIQDYGDVVSLHGGLPRIAEGLEGAFRSPSRGKLSGMGFVQEGLGYSPVVYDLMTDLMWRPEAPDLERWIDEYAGWRYGRPHPKAREAWRVLLQTLCRQSGRTTAHYCGRPSAPAGIPAAPGAPPYDPVDVAKAYDALLACADELGGVDAYRYDLVNVARQVLGELSGLYIQDVAAACATRDKARLRTTGAKLLELLRDVDKLLATREEFLLGRWIEDAKRWATNDEERRLYEWNARNQITLWGDRDSILHEYANKQWAGLVAGFYLPRWSMLIEALQAAIEEEQPFDADAWVRGMREWEDNWTHKTERYPDKPSGDSVAVARRLFEKYGGDLTDESVPNLTTGKPVTCSAFLPPSGPERANDGRRRSTNRYWATDARTDPQAWWQVDLEEPTRVGRVQVVLYFGDVRHYGLTVETSLDGVVWDVAADLRENKQLSTREGIACRFEPRLTRYVRVTVTENSANTGRHLVEVLAFAE